MTAADGVLALVRAVSPHLAACELMQLERAPIDARRAADQHSRYVAALASLGVRIEWLAPLPEHADGVFVEDTAVIVDELAVATRPGAPSRQGEVDSTASRLGRYRSLCRIEAPGTLDGGDVLRIGRTLHVGLSARTNREGVEQLAAALAPAGYAVRPIALSGCLHLKSAVTYLPPDRVLVNPAWIDAGALTGVEALHVDPQEPQAANTLTVLGTTLVSDRYPRTIERLQGAGIRVQPLCVDELHKAEAGLSCMSLLLGAVH